jgi:hypothetical protein
MPARMSSQTVREALREAAAALGMERALSLAVSGKSSSGAPAWAQQLVDAYQSAPHALADAYQRLLPERAPQGAYYTPAPLVDLAHRLLAEALSSRGLDPGRAVLIDPACGPGGFFRSQLASRYARRLGVDSDATALILAAPHADEVLSGDAYSLGRDWLSNRIREMRMPVAVIGNPPYSGNSVLLRSGRYRELRNALLPFAGDVPDGTSLRDDYVLFFGLADRLVESAGGGAIAFVTSASFLSNYLYRPLRRHLLGRYRLAASVELGGGFFEGTRVETVLTVWARDPQAVIRQSFRRWNLAGQVKEGARQRSSREAALRKAANAPETATWESAEPFTEALILRVPPAPVAATLERMRRGADPIGRVVAFSTPGLKTRFDELLVAGERRTLEKRMRAFLDGDMKPSAFARSFQIPRSLLGKVEALRDVVVRHRITFDANRIRRFVRYAGVRHRYGVPESALAFVYFDRRLILRGDHRMRGEYDPNAGKPKLIFNVREVPLSAAVFEGDGCIHDHRHARFAPLRVPVGLIGRDRYGRRGAEGPLMPNLAPWWRKAVSHLGGEAQVFDYVSGIVNSALTQEFFAPWLGASEEIPIRRPTKRNLRAARQVVVASRLLRRQAEMGAAQSAEVQARLDAAVRELYGV